MIRIRFFGPGELIQRTFRAARYFFSAALCFSLAVPLPGISCVCCGSPPHHARTWTEFHVSRPLDRALRTRLLAAASTLSGTRIPLASVPSNNGLDPSIHGRRRSSPAHGRPLGLAWCARHECDVTVLGTKMWRLQFINIVVSGVSAQIGWPLSFVLNYGVNPGGRPHS